MRPMYKPHAYRDKWRIQYEPKPIPVACGVDWDWWHDDYDGAPDSGDRRAGCARSLQAAKDEIDELILELEEGL